VGRAEAGDAVCVGSDVMTSGEEGDAVATLETEAEAEAAASEGDGPAAPPLLCVAVADSCRERVAEGTVVALPEMLGCAGGWEAEGEMFRLVSAGDRLGCMVGGTGIWEGEAESDGRPDCVGGVTCVGDGPGLWSVSAALAVAVGRGA
jgi:hypothetical protein